MTDSASTNVSREKILLQELDRNVDTEPLELDPWRPLHEACDRLCIQKPKNDQEMQQVSRLWNGRRDVELRLLGYTAKDFEFLRYFPDLERLNVQVPIVKNIEGLRHVANSLKEFTLASTTVRLSLRPVARCLALESLHLQRQAKDFGELRSIAGQLQADTPLLVFTSHNAMLLTRIYYHADLFGHPTSLYAVVVRDPFPQTGPPVTTGVKIDGYPGQRFLTQAEYNDIQSVVQVSVKNH